MNVHRIITKLGTEIRLNEPFKCAKFQPDWSANSCFMAILQSVRKEVEEKRKKPKLWPTEMDGAIFSNLECGLPYLAGTSVATLVSIG